MYENVNFIRLHRIITQKSEMQIFITFNISNLMLVTNFGNGTCYTSTIPGVAKLA
jgi:hypothetical protein